MGDDYVDFMVSLAARRDLQGLRDELAAGLAGLEEAQRPHVPTHLLSALALFLDSYGPDRWREAVDDRR